MSFPQLKLDGHHSVYSKQLLSMKLFPEKNTAVAAHAYTMNWHPFVHCLYTVHNRCTGLKKKNPVR